MCSLPCWFPMQLTLLLQKKQCSPLQMLRMLSPRKMLLQMMLYPFRKFRMPLRTQRPLQQVR